MCFEITVDVRNLAYYHMRKLSWSQSQTGWRERKSIMTVTITDPWHGALTITDTAAGRSQRITSALLQ
jgi:hypothetical protein